MALETLRNVLIAQIGDVSNSMTEQVEFLEILSVFRGKAQLALFRGLRRGLPGTAPFGDLPDLVNTSGVIDSLLGYRGYSRPIKPKFDRLRGYPQKPGDFSDCQAFHTSIFQKNFEKVNTLLLQVLDKPATFK